MVTYKYKIQNDIDITQYLKPYNNVVRFAYNQFRDFQKDPTNKGQRLKVDTIVKKAQAELNHLELLDFSLIRYAARKAEAMKDKKKIIFGGRKLFNAIKFFKLKKDPKVPLEELKQVFREKRINRPLQLLGCCSDSKGNRKADLDIIDNNSIIIKFNKKTHIKVELPELSKVHKEHLVKLQDLAQSNKACFTIEINNEFIYVIFDEKYVKTERVKEPLKNRILALDLNPNYIGLSITDWHTEESKTLIHKEIIDVTKITGIKHQRKYKRNKRDSETAEINKHIVELAQHYRCSLVAFEKLDIEAKDHCRGKNFNRLVNNCWNRTKLLQNLKKRCILSDIKFQEVLAMYSSFIGQIENETEYDSVAASLEISRRANVYTRALRENRQVQNIIFPRFTISALSTHWKKMIGNRVVKSWKELYKLVKKTKFRYRLLFISNIFTGVSSRFKSHKSGVMIRFVPV